MKKVASLVSFQKEKLRDVWDEIMFLAKEHWKETEQYQTAELNPDKERYLHYNDIGYHHQYTVRDEDRIVGHAGMYITTSMHTQTFLATEDTWYLLPEYRKGRNAIDFYQFIEEDLRKHGVEEIMMHAKLVNTSSNRIMKYLGYTHISNGYMKRIV